MAVAKEASNYILLPQGPWQKVSMQLHLFSKGWRNTYRSSWHGKGSGMIHPKMVTMLGVDGDTSTNDIVIGLASGLSGTDEISSLNS
nr:Arginine biosynthesis bifunctional protein ArgJ, chloroplastic [Ipomoea batatas]